MTNENNSEQGSISWFPYVLVVTAILVIGVVVLSTNNAPKPENKPAEVKTETAQKADISNATVKSLANNDNATNVTLPFQKGDAKDGEHFLYTFDLNYKKDASTTYSIIGDDCVEKLNINGKDVAIDMNDAGRCNWQVGITMDLKTYLKEGTNKVILEVSNNAGPSGLTVRVK